MFKTYEIEYGGKPFVMEFGKMAKQTGGSCTVRYGETVVLVTACRAPKASIGVDFMPLTANYQEMTYAAGKIPGGFFKREGRPTEREVLCSRLIDRPIRPLFVDGYSHETQVVATVMSLDSEHPAEVAAMIGASAALGISDIPFCGPIACIRVGRIDGKFVANPSMSDFEGSDIDLLVAGSEGAIAMVEGGAEGATEAEMVEALMFAQEAMKPMIELQKKIISELGKEKLVIEPPKVDEDLKAKVKEISEAGLIEALNIPTKMERYARLDEVKAELIASLGDDYADREKEAKGLFGGLKSDIMRKTIIAEKVRVDGRDPDTVRDITCEVGLLPRAHGSALFTRGETQAMVVTTLGTSDDEQRIDALLGWEYKSFMLHYNFPPWSVGEVRFLRGPGRREIGHGALAERAVSKIMPGEDAEFPYVMRVVSEILESNGSSSMASVCGASLALMDAGVPTKGHVAGIAMGLVKEGDDYVILTDILGDEDHIGDMDFKVAGTKDGITALQMDIKIGGVTAELMSEALDHAKNGRLTILSKMEEALSTHRDELSTHAPRIITLQVRPERIKDVIGPGGKNIKGIVHETGVKINVDDAGIVSIASSDDAAAAAAVKMVKDLTMEAEVGKLYMGTVRKIMDFGAFVEIFPGTDGLVHVSQLAKERVENVTDILKEGDKVLVKVLEVDRGGKIRLSRKEALGQTLPEEDAE